ncbi:MAG TPA: hypothetical protein VHR66_06885, partial [Gemmataceae bacterium]|nr:hypothetical protein [Gemmataceae bacterium]
HSDLSADLAIAELRMFVDRQGQAISLNFLHESRASPNGVASGLPKIVAKVQGVGFGPGMIRLRAARMISVPFSLLPNTQRNPDVICETDH